MCWVAPIDDGCYMLVCTTVVLNVAQRLVLSIAYHGYIHRIRMPREEIAFTSWPKIQFQSQIFRYSCIKITTTQTQISRQN